VATRKKGKRSSPEARAAKSRAMRKWRAKRQELLGRGAAHAEGYVPPRKEEKPRARPAGSKPRLCRRCGAKLNCYSGSRELCLPCLNKKMGLL